MAGPSSFDMLALNGILPYDVEGFVTGTPSEYLTRMGCAAPCDPSLRVTPQDFVRPQLNMEDVQLPAQPEQDIFISGKPHPLDGGHSIVNAFKTLGAVGLAVYVLGFIFSLGNRSPMKGLKAIGNAFSWVGNKFMGIFKK